MRITASDRSNLIRLASELEAGSDERRAILSGLAKVGMEFATKEALEAYLKEHPGADKSLHSVKKDSPEQKQPSGKDLSDLFGDSADLVYFTKPSSGEEKRVDLGDILKKIPSVTDASSAAKASKLFSGIKKKMDSHRKPHTPVRKRLWELADAGEQLNKALSEGRDPGNHAQKFEKALGALKSEVKKS